MSHDDPNRSDLDALGEALRQGLRTEGRLAPPAGAASRVMAAIPLRPPGWKGRLLAFYTLHFGAEAWLPGKVIARLPGNCGFFFLAVGALHLAMGGMMQLRLDAFLDYMPFWLRAQPLMAHALGLLVLGLGALLLGRSRQAFRLARLGVGLYFLVVLCNVAAIVISLPIPGMFLAAVALLGCGVIMGAFLGTVLFSCTGGRNHAA